MPAQQPDAAQAAAVLVAYQQATSRLRLRLTGMLDAIWRSLGAYRDAQMAQFLNQALPIVEGAQQQMAALTAAFVSGRTGSVEASVDPAKVTGAAVRNGTQPADVYSRAFHQVWRDIGAGIDPQQAIESGEKRIEQAALTDLQLTKTHTAQAVMAESGVKRWIRVPEGAHTCALCLIASTQTYSVEKLAPIHPGCDCQIAPAPEDFDGSQLLQDVHAAVEKAVGTSDPGGRRPDYRDLLIVHEHGELGPVLARAGQAFTGPHDLGS